MKYDPNPNLGHIKILNLTYILDEPPHVTITDIIASNIGTPNMAAPLCKKTIS